MGSPNPMPPVSRCWCMFGLAEMHHPAAFAAALINSQPMGFYAPAQIIRDAREHGWGAPVDVNHSRWDCTLEPAGPDDDACGPPALRLASAHLRPGETEARKIMAAVAARGPFDSVTALWRAGGTRAAVRCEPSRRPTPLPPWDWVAKPHCGP